MSFLSREKLKLFPNSDKLYDYLIERFNALESRIKELETRLNQNSKNSHKPPSSDIFKKERYGKKQGKYFK